MANPRQYGVPIDLTTNELQNAIIQVLSGPPTGIAGRVYYDSTLHQFGYYNGTVWVYSVTIPDASTIVKGIVQLTNHLSGTATSPVVNGFTLTADGNANTHKITGLVTPTASTDAANKSYVDVLTGGLQHFVRIKPTVNVTISNPGTSTFDGVGALTGDRLLMTSQTTVAENGIWVFNGSATPMTRPSDWASGSTRKTGETVLVAAGTANQGLTFYVVAVNPVVDTNDPGMGGVNMVAIPTGGASGDLTGTYPNPTIAAGAVTVAKTASSLTLDAIATAHATAANVNINSHKLTGVSAPTTTTDATNRAWIDGVSDGIMHFVRAATTTAITASNPATSTFDGVALVSGEHVLLLGQTNPVENGPWIFNGAASALTRPNGWQTGATFAGTAALTVAAGGTLNGGKFYRSTSSGVVGTDDPTLVAYLPFAAPSGAAGGDLAGTYPNPTIAANAVTVAKLAAAVTLDAIATAHATAADVAMNSHKITGLSNGTAAGDAVNFGQLQGVQQGVFWKSAAQWGSSAAQTYTSSGGALTAIAGTTFGGGSPAVGERLLIFDALNTAANSTANNAGVATTNLCNGIYVVTNATTNLTIQRDTDADTAAELQGAVIEVEEGTLARKIYQQSTYPVTTLNTTALAFVNFQSATDLTFGVTSTVLAKTGNAVDIVPPGAAATATNGSTTLGATGLAIVRKFDLKHDGSTTAFAFSHAMSTDRPVVSVYAAATKALVDVDVVATSSSVITLNWQTALPAGTEFYGTIVG